MLALELFDCLSRAGPEHAVGTARHVNTCCHELLLQVHDRCATSTLRETQQGTGRKPEFERSCVGHDPGSRRLFLLHTQGTDWGVRADHSMELPPADGGMEMGTGPRHWQHNCHEARRTNAAQLPPAG